MSGALDSLCLPPEAGAGFSTLGDVNRAGEMFCDTPNDFTAIRKVQEYRTFRMRCLATTLNIIDCIAPPSRALVSVRLKRLDSIRRKIGRAGTQFKLGQMDDIIGVRVVCPTFQDACDINGRVQAASEFNRCKNYLDDPHPKGTGYRAMHNIMRFQQALTADKSVNVRFEIQIRSYLQHRWAIWSEAHGEEAKAGHVSENVRRELREISARISRWEDSNPAKTQNELMPYVDAKSIVVAWRIKDAAPLCIPFHDNTDAAVRHLNYLEMKHPAERGNALLLVGASDPGQVEKVLRQTHPLYTATRVVAPQYWMPQDS